MIYDSALAACSWFYRAAIAQGDTERAEEWARRYYRVWQQKTA